MNFVLDSSLTAAILFEDEAIGSADVIRHLSQLKIRRTLGLGSLDTDLRKATKTEKVPLLPKA